MKDILHILLFSFLLASCGSKSNHRGIKLEELDRVIAEEKQAAPPAPTRAALTISELLALSSCGNIACVQAYMKDRSHDFSYPVKGEYCPVKTTAIADSGGKQFIMPPSRLFFPADGGGNGWWIEQVLYKKELSDQLLSELQNAGFTLTDSAFNNRMKAMTHRYQSPNYPGISIRHTVTFFTYDQQMLYRNGTMRCYVVEVVSVGSK